MSKLIDRRGFGRVCAGLATAALVSGSLPSVAADLPHVDENGAQAKALGYRNDASTVDKTKFANYVAGSVCSGCQLFQGGSAEWGACALFAGSAVNAKGWCSAFAKKPA